MRIVFGEYEIDFIIYLISYKTLNESKLNQ